MAVGKGLGGSLFPSLHSPWGQAGGLAAPGWICYSFCSWLFWWKNRRAPIGTAEVERVSVAGRLSWQSVEGQAGPGWETAPAQPLCFYVALQAQAKS